MSEQSHGHEPILRCVIVGGAGEVGGMFVRLLARSGAEVCVVDPRPAPSRSGAAPWTRHLQGDITAPGPELLAELRTTDMVMLAVPEQVALDAAELVAAELRTGALFAHTLSVQGPISELLRAKAPDVQAVGLNPMFAPSLGMDGRPVVAVLLRQGPRARELLRLIGTWGGQVVHVSGDEHDSLAAASQVLTHAVVLSFGFALQELGVSVKELGAVAPPPHVTMLALLARIADGTPEVYWDVQSANPEASRGREALLRGVRRLMDLTEARDVEAFTSAVTELRGVLGPDLGVYADVCAQSFQRLPSARTVAELRRKFG